MPRHAQVNEQGEKVKSSRTLDLRYYRAYAVDAEGKLIAGARIAFAEYADKNALVESIVHLPPDEGEEILHGRRLELTYSVGVRG